MSFTTVKIPGAELVFTNYVYVHPQHANLLKYTDKPNYVLIEGTHVYIVQASDRLEPGTIGINSLQRETLNVGENAAVQVQQYKLTRDEQAGLLLIKADLQLIKTKRMTLKEVEITKHLQKYYSGQVFARGQVFVADLGVGAVRFTIRALEAANLAASEAKDNGTSDDISRYVERGLVITSTDWELESKEDPKVLRFEKNNSNKRSKLLNPDWKFEDMGTQYSSPAHAAHPPAKQLRSASHTAIRVVSSKS
jgi:hypothetical protein